MPDLRDDYVSEDPSLMFYTQVLHLDSLHWGLWEPGDEISVPNMKRAQHRFTEHLASFIPQDVKKILDVGCGIGDNSRYLYEHGYQMTAVSPDINHERAFNKMGLQGVRFIRSQFEKVDLAEKFDAILMSESNSYFGSEICFEQCDKLLRDGGYVLSASLFRKNHNEGKAYHYHVMEDWLGAAERHGYEIIKFDDITERALPTLSFFHWIFKDYGEPTVKVMMRLFELAPGRRMKLVRWLLRDRINALAAAPLKSALTKGDPERFRKEGLYTVHLLKKGAKKA